LSADGGILPSQSRQKPFQFLLARQMKRELFEVVAKSPDAALRRQHKALPPNDFRKPVRRFIGNDSAIMVCEPLLGY